jgi:hypothetical protein
MIKAAMILPAIAPTAVLLSLDGLAVDVGAGRIELEVGEVWVDEPVSNDPVEVTDDKEVCDDRSDVKVDDVGNKVEEGGVVKDEGRVGVTFVELGGVGDTGRGLAAVGDVGPP